MASTTADPVEAKIETEFVKLDLNKDGHLDWSDYEILIDRYRKTSRVSDGDRRIKALRAFYQMHWAELLRHADVDEDRLSKEQFVSATRKVTEDTSRINVTEAGGHVIFDLIDVDGDGEISADELSRYLQGVWQIKESDASYAMQELDRDGNQSISREEFVSGVRDHLQ